MKFCIAKIDCWNSLFSSLIDIYLVHSWWVWTAKRKLKWDLISSSSDSCTGWSSYKRCYRIRICNFQKASPPKKIIIICLKRSRKASNVKLMTYRQDYKILLHCKFLFSSTKVGLHKYPQSFRLVYDLLLASRLHILLYIKLYELILDSNWSCRWTKILQQNLNTEGKVKVKAQVIICLLFLANHKYRYQLQNLIQRNKIQFSLQFHIFVVK